MRTATRINGGRAVGKTALKLLSLALLSLWLVPMLALAQEPTAPPAGQPTTTQSNMSRNATSSLGGFANTAGYNTSSAATPTAIIGNIIGYALALLGVVFTILTIYAGFLWMTAQGNEEQISKAKKMLTNAVIGMVIIGAAYAISSFVITQITASV